jgi:hypothetical protein
MDSPPPGLLELWRALKSSADVASMDINEQRHIVPLRVRLSNLPMAVPGDGFKDINASNDRH